MTENALLSTKTTLFFVLMRNNETAPVEPIVLRRLQLRCGEWSVRALRVNRHLQPFDHFAPHRHAHGQLLLYLRGQGEQRIGRKRFAVGPGAVFFIPPGRIHEFRENAPRRAICLVADLGGRAPRSIGLRSGWLSAESLAAVRQQVAALSADRGKALELSAGGAALLVIDHCRRAVLHQRARGEGSAIMKRLQRAWRRSDYDTAWPRPAELARRVGLQKDYLNRLVRRGSGLTLGQWRDRELLREAEAALRKGLGVGDTAAASGFRDASYFARWFRKQTGLPPSQWKAD